MEDKQYHSPLEKKNDGPLVWRNFWPITFIPFMIAFINPTTGVYIVDVLTLASPMLLALVLLYFSLTAVRQFLLKHLDEKIRSTRAFAAAFLIGSLTASLSAGVFVESLLRRAALEHYGHSQNIGALDGAAIKWSPIIKAIGPALLAAVVAVGLGVACFYLFRAMLPSSLLSSKSRAARLFRWLVIALLVLLAASVGGFLRDAMFSA